MSIPLDKLYHYIESIARDVCKDNIVIYRFFPHGSKKLDDLSLLHSYSWDSDMSIELYCNDQEPLSWETYDVPYYTTDLNFRQMLLDNNIIPLNKNLRKGRGIYDDSILLHSELNSPEVEKYKASNFRTVYYWAHGIIAQDWFRYAQYESIDRSIDSKKTFLIYNRAWSGTREYRLKFVDLLIENNLTNHCKSFFNPVEPQDNVHYRNHVYTNTKLTAINTLENYFCSSEASSNSSADYNLQDYLETDIEVVLETLFDDDRIQLTEKILRPIALGQPFILASSKGSLNYLKSYGFKTFNEVFDESYDSIEDPVERLTAITNTMKEILFWDEDKKIEKMKLARAIAEHNRNLFFSDKFFNQIINELKTNLLKAYTEIINDNTSKHFLNRRKTMYKHECMRSTLINGNFSKVSVTRQQLVSILKKARSYYMRTLSK